jgi:hypothetical protein
MHFSVVCILYLLKARARMYIEYRMSLISDTIKFNFEGFHFLSINCFPLISSEEGNWGVKAE